MKITEAIKEFEFEQHIRGLALKYRQLCLWRMNDWKSFTIDELNIDDVTEITEQHIKHFIQFRLQLGHEKTKLLITD